MPGFSVPEVDANPDGWGPTTVPEQLDGVPYAPFGKGDKIGRVSDFTNSGFNKYGGMLAYTPPLSGHAVGLRLPHAAAPHSANAARRPGFPAEPRAGRGSVQFLRER